MYEITVGNHSYLVEIMDCCHCRWRIKDSPYGWATPEHILQITDAMRSALEAAGAIENNVFATEGD